MLIKKKVIIFIILSNLIALVLIYFAFKLIISTAYTKIELDNSAKNIERIMNAIDTRVSYIKAFNKDYAMWDDTYEFISTQDPAYVDSNLTIDIFKTFRINFVVFINPEGNIVYSKAVDSNAENYADLPIGLVNYIFKDAPLINHNTTDSVIKGVLNLERDNIIISSLPVTHSDGSGPINGTLLFGRYIDAAEIAYLKGITNFDFNIYSYKQLQANLTATLGVYEGQKDLYITPKDRDYLVGYKLQRDIFGKPALVVQALLPRQLEREGIRTFSVLMVFILLIGVIFSTCGIVFLNKNILKRINSLSTQVNQIKNTKSKVKIEGKDEVSTLAANINKMIDEIESTSSELKSVNDLLVNKTMDLEKINKLLIGREVKMTELKERIRELEGSLGNDTVNK